MTKCSSKDLLEDLKHFPQVIFIETTEIMDYTTKFWFRGCTESAQ